MLFCCYCRRCCRCRRRYEFEEEKILLKNLSLIRRRYGEERTQQKVLFSLIELVKLACFTRHIINVTIALFPLIIKLSSMPLFFSLFVSRSRTCFFKSVYCFAFFRSFLLFPLFNCATQNRVFFSKMHPARETDRERDPRFIGQRVILILISM